MTRASTSGIGLCRGLGFRVEGRRFGALRDDDRYVDDLGVALWLD